MNFKNSIEYLVAFINFSATLIKVQVLEWTLFSLMILTWPFFRKCISYTGNKLRSYLYFK